MDQQERKKNLKINKKESKDNNSKTRVTLPYVRGVSKALSLAFCHHGVTTLIMPHVRILVHPKDKHTPQEHADVQKCSVPGPMQGLSMCLHVGGGEKVWMREKENNRDVKTL